MHDDIEIGIQTTHSVGENCRYWINQKSRAETRGRVENSALLLNAADDRSLDHAKRVSFPLSAVIKKDCGASISSTARRGTLKGTRQDGGDKRRKAIE